MERPLKQVVPTHPDHILQFKIQNVQESYLEMGMAVFATVDPKLLRHYARTLMIDWEPIGIIGVSPYWEGNCWCWAYLGSKCLEHPAFLTRQSRKYIEKARATLNLRRMAMSVSVGHTAALEWADILGFKVEGLMRSYGPKGEDCHLLAKVWDERI